jgi:hypothetical protein
MRINTDQETCPVCRKKETWSHILPCEGTWNLRDILLEKKVHKYRPGNAIRKIAHNKIKYIWSKTGQHLKIKMGKASKKVMRDSV